MLVRNHKIKLQIQDFDKLCKKRDFFWMVEIKREAICLTDIKWLAIHHDGHLLNR